MATGTSVTITDAPERSVAAGLGRDGGTDASAPDLPSSRHERPIRPRPLPVHPAAVGPLPVARRRPARGQRVRSRARMARRCAAPSGPSIRPAPGPPRRLTRSGPGESSAAFTRDGDLLFTSTRPDPDRSPDDKPDTEPLALWSLPASTGEARLVVAPGGGVEAFGVAAGADVVVVRAPVHPGTSTFAEDAEREKARTKAGVAARLYEGYPIRFWDHYLGPRESHLFLLRLDESADGRSPVPRGPDARRRPGPRRDRVRRAARWLRCRHGLDDVARPGPSDPGPGASSDRPDGTAGS